MYEYKDYFDEEYRNVPYREGREELEDWLRFLDMVLEGYLRHKGLGREEKLFSRGLVITESELESYFGQPPYMRERDVCDPELAAAVTEARAYIANRVARTFGVLNPEELQEPAEDEIVLSDGEEEPEDKRLLALIANLSL